MSEKTLSEIVSVNLKRRIKQSQYRTQENFAFEFGAEPRTVSRWLNGGLKNIDTIEEIAYFLDIDPLGLFEE